LGWQDLMGGEPMSGNCGFDALDWEMLGNGGIQLWHQDGLQDPEITPMASDASFSQTCKCDQDVASTVRSLSRADMSHDILQMLRAGVSLTDRLLTCPICYDVSKPPRVTVQNVLLVGQLMLEITSTYQKYLRWVNKHCAELDARNESETVYVGSGLVNLRVSGDKFRDLVMHGLETDAEQLLALGKRFAQRQRNRHMAGHETCPDPEGRCRKKEYDPLDLCPQIPSARKLVPCFRIVDEVQGMIKEVADAVVNESCV
jgi:hypothetical protein